MMMLMMFCVFDFPAIVSCKPILFISATNMFYYHATNSIADYKTVSRATRYCLIYCTGISIFAIIAP